MYGCEERGIAVLSVYAFSTENWARPRAEVRALMRLFHETLEREFDEIHSRGIRIIGATLTPFGNETFMANAWNPTRETHRVAVNTWIRESGAFDGVEIKSCAERRMPRKWQFLRDSKYPHLFPFPSLGCGITR